MATLTTKLSIAGTGLTSNQLAININDLLSVTTPHVGLSKLSVATGSASVLVASSVSAATYVYIRNTEAAGGNFVTLETDGTEDWGRLEADNWAFFPVAPSVGLQVRSDTASVVIEYAIFQRP